MQEWADSLLGHYESNDPPVRSLLAPKFIRSLLKQIINQESLRVRLPEVNHEFLAEGNVAW